LNYFKSKKFDDFKNILKTTLKFENFLCIKVAPGHKDKNKLGLHFYDFSAILYGFYNILCFRSRVEDSFYKEVLGRFLGFTVLPSVNIKVPGSFNIGPWILHSSPCKFLMFCIAVQRGQGRHGRRRCGRNPANWQRARVARGAGGDVKFT
jgi:hypothetical protein